MGNLWGALFIYLFLILHTVSLCCIPDYQATCSVQCVGLLAVLASMWTLLFLYYFLAFLYDFFFSRRAFYALRFLTVCQFQTSLWLRNAVKYCTPGNISGFKYRDLNYPFGEKLFLCEDNDMTIRTLQVGFICFIKRYTRVLFWLLSLQKAWPSSRDNFCLRDWKETHIKTCF